MMDLADDVSILGMKVDSLMSTHLLEAARVTELERLVRQLTWLLIGVAAVVGLLAGVLIAMAIT